SCGLLLIAVYAVLNHCPRESFLKIVRASKYERSLDQRANKLKRKRKKTAEKENSPASVTDGWMKP
ncbi:hypothetical protein KIL84_018430, partial [Mauremys mutica]